jgi:Lrp/AsnC family transcriptional regulator, leucine-responsive regulatory protein
MALDSSDRKILRLLQSNGRMTNQELAINCNISPSACHERFKRLKDEGYIVGFSAILNAEKLQKGFVAYAQVQLNSNAARHGEEFTSAVSKLIEVMECYMMAGNYDYLLKIQVADMHAYKDLLVNTLLQLPYVQDVRSFPVLDRVKYDTQLPI